MRALILDRTHAVLVDERGHLPEVRGTSARPLRDLEAGLAARGVPALPAPCGSRPTADGRDFAFVVERFAAPAGLAWRALREVTGDDATWDLYTALLLGGYAPSTRALDVWSFGDRPEMAAQLAHLVVCGTKRVTMGWIDATAHSGTPLPYVGGISVVTDGFGYPRVVLETTAVTPTRFADVDAAAAAGEGEGDLTHADWREGHVAYFTREAARYGLVFDDDARIAVETFAIVHVVGA